MGPQQLQIIAESMAKVILSITKNDIERDNVVRTIAQLTGYGKTVIKRVENE